jgi:hypothetical protein
LQRFNAMILARDPICVVDGCTARATEVDHDPPLLERPDGASPYDPSTAFGQCREHHLQATRELRLRHGLPYAPGAPHRERTAKPSLRVTSRELPTVWEGALSIPITGPARVVRRGQMIDVPAGVVLPADEREW